MRALSLAITVDPNIPVPPRLYGGIERVVDFLVRGLVARGHQVILLAHPDSTVGSTLVPYGVPPHVGRGPRVRELVQVGAALLRRVRDLDVVHSFGRLAALLPVLPIRHLAKIQSYQRDELPWRSIRIASRLGGRSMFFTGCSTSVFRERDRQAPRPFNFRRIFNGVDLTKYHPEPNVDSDAPLAFLGRIEPVKGTHHAIAIARRSGRRLIIAGNRVETGSASGYFEREIAPHLDGDRVQWVGPLDDAGKNGLLGRAAALLHPVEFEEPFGIVMAEAMACGTPVIGFARGSLPEVIVDGENGFLCRSVDDAIAAVARLDLLDRRRVRADCEARFSHHRIVDEYEKLYFEIKAQSVRQ